MEVRQLAQIIGYFQLLIKKKEDKSIGIFISVLLLKSAKMIAVLDQGCISPFLPTSPNPSCLLSLTFVFLSLSLLLFFCFVLFCFGLLLFWLDCTSSPLKVILTSGNIISNITEHTQTNFLWMGNSQYSCHSKPLNQNFVTMNISTSTALKNSKTYQVTGR